MPTHQTEFDWDDASHKAAAQSRRMLLTRVKKALKGRMLGNSSNPKNQISGAVIAIVLDGLHGWTIKHGWTDRKPEEIGQPLSGSRCGRALSYLQSVEAECCVAVEPFRSHGSPRNRRSICWSNLHAWCERLEADPVTPKTRVAKTVSADTTPADRKGHPCGAMGSTPADRVGHPCGPQGSYKEDGPKTVQMASSTVEQTADSPEGGGIKNGIEDERERTSPQDCDRQIHRSRLPDSHLRDRDSSLSADRCIDELPIPDSPSSREGVSDRSDDPTIALRTYRSRVLPRHEQDHSRETRDELSGDFRSGHQPSAIRHEPLVNRIKSLGITAASACHRKALQSLTTDQLSELLDYAESQRIGDLLPWSPEFLFHRLSSPDNAALPPSEGWVKPSAPWTAAKARKRQQEAEEAASRRSEAERWLSRHSDEAEALYGPLIDQLYQTDKQRLLAGLLPGDFLYPDDKFTMPRVRRMFLLAARLGRYSTQKND